MVPPDTLRFLSGAPPPCPSTVPSVRDAAESGIRLAVGTVIGGAYRVIDHLGSGSMGTVVLAYDDTQHLEGFTVRGHAIVSISIYSKHNN